MTTDLPRLFRYVEPGAMPGLDLLAIYDAGMNLLIINRYLFDQLSEEDKRATLRTHETSLVVDLRNFTVN